MQPRLSPGKQLLLLTGIYGCCMLIGQLIGNLIVLSNHTGAFEKGESFNPMLLLTAASATHFITYIGAFFVFLRVAGYSFSSLIPKTRFSTLILFSLPVLALFGIIGGGALSGLSLSFFESVGFYEIVQDELLRQEQMTPILVHQNPAQLALSIFTLCLLPAVGEELIFRGVLQSRIMMATHDRHFSVIISAVIFSAVHLQPVNLLSIALLGLVLGYLYSYTKNIWYCVILHFLINAIQVVQLYFWPGQLP